MHATQHVCHLTYMSPNMYATQHVCHPTCMPPNMYATQHYATLHTVADWDLNLMR